MTDPDPLGELLKSPLIPLHDEWRSVKQASDLREARSAEARSADDYWVWAASQQRWSNPWRAVREGGMGDARYFVDGTLNVADNCLDRYAEAGARSNHPAVIWEGEPGEVRTLSYSQLRDETSSLAAGLVANGIGKGDVVAIYMPNLPEAYTAIHACNRIGAIYTVLFAGFSVDAIASRLKASDAVAVITADVSYRRGRPVALLDNLRRALDGASAVRTVVVVDRSGEDAALLQNEVSYARLVGWHPDGIAPLPLEANDPSFLIFTSGTEASPKGLVHSVGGFLIGAWANVKWQIGPDDDDVYWCAADVGWLTFPIQSVIGGLAHGMTLVAYEGALDSPSPSRFYEICERHGVTKVLAAPTALRMLRRFGDELADEHKLNDLRLVSVQGEPLDAETFSWASERLGPGVPVVNGYGQTETGSTWTYPVYGVDDLKAGSCGRPVPGHSYAIVDDSGRDVLPGTRGNLVLTAPFPTMARTIWKNHDRYLQSYFERFPGRYVTSDEAVEDTDGHIWVLGRADDVINVAAHRISTMEIESAIAEHQDVAEAAVVGATDPVRGTRPVAFVVLRSGVDAENIVDQVKDRVERAIGGIARVDSVFVVETLPRTRAGKTMRRLLREIVDHGTATGDRGGLDDPASVDHVIDVVTGRQPASSGP
jgi:acetyl-CoA synthetase